jgi:predicted TIM-barrel fold metal-dependent hydrolase
MIRGGDVELSAIPVIDAHCHSITASFQDRPVESFLRIFTEAADDRLIAQHVPHSLTYRRAIRDLAAFLACAPTAEAILEARRRRSNYLAALCHDAGIRGLLIDSGYPPGALSPSQLQAELGCRVGEVVRIETIEEELLLTAADFTSFEERFRAALQVAKRQGAVALKSIVAYRSGLAVRRVPASEARQTFQQLKALVERQGHLRLTAKPLLDYCVGIALEEAQQLALPVQFHTGFGDPDIDILTANPALLRPILADPCYAGVPRVLLHMGYPYVREAAFLASLYPDVWVDISLVVPLLCPLVPHLLQELLALTPATKILYGSDGHSQPEMFWLGARYSRWALTKILAGWIKDGTLGDREALDIAERICFRNALEVYRLDSTWRRGMMVSATPQ